MNRTTASLGNAQSESTGLALMIGMTSLVPHALGGTAFAQLIECRLESRGQFFVGPSAPVMKENHHWSVAGHVVMDRHHVKTILAKRLQHRGDFAFEHRHVARHRCVLLCSHESRPGVEPHPGVNRGSVFLHTQVVTPDGDLVDCSRLFAVMPNDLREFGGVNGSSAGPSWGRSLRLHMADEV